MLAAAGLCNPVLRQARVGSLTRPANECDLCARCHLLSQQAALVPLFRQRALLQPQPLASFGAPLCALAQATSLGPSFHAMPSAAALVVHHAPPLPPQSDAPSQTSHPPSPQRQLLPPSLATVTGPAAGPDQRADRSPLVIDLTESVSHTRPRGLRSGSESGPGRRSSHCRHHSPLPRPPRCARRHSAGRRSRSRSRHARGDDRRCTSREVQQYRSESSETQSREADLSLRPPLPPPPQRMSSPNRATAASVRRSSPTPSMPACGFTFIASSTGASDGSNDRWLTASGVIQDYEECTRGMDVQDQLVSSDEERRYHSPHHGAVGDPHGTDRRPGSPRRRSLDGSDARQPIEVQESPHSQQLPYFDSRGSSCTGGCRRDRGRA